MNYIETNEIVIRQFTWDVQNSNSFLIQEGSHALLIDAVASEKLFRRLKDINDLTIILTHCHYDHICGLNQIRKMHPGARVFATELCSRNIQLPKKNLSNTANALIAFQNHSQEIVDVVKPFSAAAATDAFEGDTSIIWQGHRIQLTSFKGHSADGIVITIDGKLLFSGDTLLPIPTLTRLPGGSTSQFWENDIPRLEKMNVAIVFPGHGEPGKLADMLAVNQRPSRPMTDSIQFI